MFRRGDSGVAQRRDAIVVMRRLAALVQGGVPFSRAWQYLVDADDVQPSTSVLLGAVAGAAIDGGDVPSVILAGIERWSPRTVAPWRLAALCLRIAVRSGAPMAECLRTVATILTDAEDGAQDVEAALAGARSSTRVVMSLPFIGVGLAAIMGFDLFGFLTGTLLGLACLGAACGMMLLALFWNRRLVAGALHDDGDTGLGSELVAMAMLGGAAAGPAVQHVEASIAEFGAERITIETSRVTIDLSAQAGVPASSLLRSAAEDARAATRVRSRIRVARLEVRLLVPLGVCILPAFALLSVVPLVATIVSSTVAEL